MHEQSTLTPPHPRTTPVGIPPPRPDGVVVNDFHSQLNSTRVQRIEKPTTIEALQAALRRAQQTGSTVSIAGARGAMGGQQFGTGALLLDVSAMNRVVSFDADRGLIEAEAGIQWPALIDFLVRTQRGQSAPWSIIQKQTGADCLSLGGALSANVHGRGLRFKPLIADVESFTLVDATGRIRRCSRTENADLFTLAIGGYGLFGVIATVTLRLMQRCKLERIVELIDVDTLMTRFEQRIANGFLYGDFQYATDRDSDDFLRRGVFSCYRPVAASTPMLTARKQLSADDWKKLYVLGHTDRKRAFALYSQHYLATSGQIYWSDTHQLSTYVDDYHKDVDRATEARVKGSEMITELYVPRDALAAFLADVRTDCRRHQVEVIYGTIRLIEEDDESFLAWARRPWACVIFNLHVAHDPPGLAKAKRDFRRLIDRAVEYHGSYYLTYHRWATRRQIEACYPQLPAFLRLKKEYDPDQRFCTDWYRQCREMFAV